MKLKEAVKKAEEFIQSFTPEDWGQVEIIYWGKGKWGFRVAEISFNRIGPSGKSIGGSSIMQSDWLLGAVPIWAVERYVLHLLWGKEFDNPDLYEDLLLDHKEMVKEAILRDD